MDLLRDHGEKEPALFSSLSHISNECFPSAYKHADVFLWKTKLRSQHFLSFQPSLSFSDSFESCLCYYLLSAIIFLPFCLKPMPVRLLPPVFHHTAFCQDYQWMVSVTETLRPDLCYSSYLNYHHPLTQLIILWNTFRNLTSGSLPPDYAFSVSTADFFLSSWCNLALRFSIFLLHGDLSSLMVLDTLYADNSNIFNEPLPYISDSYVQWHIINRHYYLNRFLQYSYPGNDNCFLTDVVSQIFRPSWTPFFLPCPTPIH